MSPEPRPSDAGADAAPPEPRLLVLFGVPIHDVTEEETVAWVLARARSRRPGQLVTSNLDFLLQARNDPEMHRIHLEGDLVLPDGMPLVWSSGLFGPPLRERVAGSDLVPRLAEAARDHGLSVYAVGGAPGVADKALGILKERYPGLRVAGTASPEVAPILALEDGEILRKVREAGPDILFVALGAPKQDKWIRLHRDALGVPAMIGIGGSLDFVAGVQSRAPAWLQRIGLEWFWRLAGQPRRLFKRYLHDFLFLATMLLRFALLRCSPAGATRLPAPPAAAELSGRGAAPAAMDRLGAAPDPGTRSVVLDLSRRLWLDSADLGTLVSLARRCRERGGRLFLVGRAPRVERLLRLHRLERFLELPTSTADLDEALEKLDGSDSAGEGRFTRSEHRLRILLPSEFARGNVDRIRAGFLEHWGGGKVREVVLDASGMSFIDSAGARFLLGAQRLAARHPGRSVWIRGFAEADLRRMRREGLDSLRVDRRRGFRTEAGALDPVLESGGREPA